MSWAFVGIIINAMTGQPVSPELISDERFATKASCDAAVMENYELDWAISPMYYPDTDTHLISFIDNGRAFVYVLQCQERAGYVG